jgi:hypothetical protein
LRYIVKRLDNGYWRVYDTQDHMFQGNATETKGEAEVIANNLNNPKIRQA